MGSCTIHPTAIVSPHAKIGDSVSIGAFTIIYDNVVIGNHCTIESHCEIGYPSKNADGKPLIIGAESHIRSYSVFYEGSIFGEKLTTGHRVSVREKTQAGKNFQIGTLSDIQGHCTIGDFTKLHSNVHIAQHATIGNYVWLFPYVVLTNDPHPPSTILQGVTLEDYVVVASMSVILPGVTVKNGALIGAHSSVSLDVDPDTVAVGSPAKFVCKTSMIRLRDGSGKSAYPWRKHFHRGYSPEVVESWIKEFS